ncbi:hypothetical protein HDU79_000516 [Rhizoclosmatium sp. JEL0117]|nr:hypothetical protein HDU79_000516 [Rhizoclosmatium sp. JEL0117]
MATEDSGDFTFDCIVIGAGIAGLAAAESLRKAGCTSLCLLEARDRIGGRILTQEIQETPLDLGASCIRGTSGNPLSNLNLRVHSIENVLVFDEGGNPLDADLSNSLINTIWAAKERLKAERKEEPAYSKLEVDDSFMGKRRKSWWERMGVSDSVERDTSSVNVNPPDLTIDLKQPIHIDELIDAFKEEEETISVRDWLMQDSVLQEEFHQTPLLRPLTNILELTDGADLTQISFRNHSKREFSGPHLYAPDGLWDLLKIAAGGILSTSSEVLKLNQQVTCIDYSNALESELYPISVHTTHGTTYAAKTVICTLPLGILQSQHQSLFHPPLPPDHQIAISKLGVGLIDKIVLEFPHPFWAADLDGFWTFLPESGVRRGMDFDEGAEEPGLVWFVNIEKMHRKEGVVGPAVLVAHVSQRHARRIEEMEDGEVEDLFMDMLRLCFEREDNDGHVLVGVPEPLSVRVTRWEADPFSMGAAVYLPVRTGASIADIITLSEPVPFPETVNNPTGCQAIHFAGDHTSPHHFGTVHGALMSGLLEADNVALSLGISK